MAIPDFSIFTKTRGGSKVLITYQFDSGSKPIHGAYLEPIDGQWIPCSWTVNGFYDPTETLIRGLDILIPTLDGTEAA